MTRAERLAALSGYVARLKPRSPDSERWLHAVNRWREIRAELPSSSRRDDVDRAFDGAILAPKLAAEALYRLSIWVEGYDAAGVTGAGDRETRSA